MTKLRCFIAVEVNDPDVLENIQSVQQEFLSSGAKLKLVERENLHFTLHFLGDIDEARIPELANIFDEIEGEPFELELTGVGCFRPQRPRIIWVGCTTGADQLIRHQNFLGHQLRAHRFPSEQRKYSPHLTIIRVRRGDHLGELIQQHANHAFGKLQVTAIKLKKSTLTPKGPIYEDLAVKQFNTKS